MPEVDPRSEPGHCTHRPPSPGQSLCQCGHLRIEAQYAAAIAGVTIPDTPAPGPIPVLTQDADGWPDVPSGWDRLVLDGNPRMNAAVLCGWDEAGVFHQWGTTEAIVTAMFTDWDDVCMGSSRG